MMWRLAEQGGKQVIFFTISVVIARLVAPSQFGMIAMLTVFTSIAGLFTDIGLSTALMRKNNRTQTDCSTVYWYNVGAGLILYSSLFVSAPYVADFYQMSELKAILRVTALSFIISPLAGVHNTLLAIDLNFKAMTKFNILSLVTSGLIGMMFAYLDFQVWALVIQNLVQCILSTTIVLCKVKWRPSFVFSKSSFKEFFGFSSKLLASRMLDTLYNNIYPIVIGKWYTASDLAFFNRGQSITNLTANLPTGMLQSVTYPMLCKLQDDEDALRNGYRRTLKLAAFVVFPITLGVGAIAFPLINVLYTDVWIYAAGLLSIMVFNMMWYPIAAINLNLLVVKGKSNLFLRLEIIKKIQGILILLITIPMGLKAMCWGSVVGAPLCLVWNTYYTGKFLKMGIIDQLRDLSHILALCAAMYICAKLVATYMGNDLPSLICSIATGAIIYIGGALLFRFPEVKELMNLKK